MGFIFILSAIAPAKGVETALASAKLENIRPISVAVAPMFCAYEGSSGMTIPMPSMTTKVIQQTVVRILSGCIK
jgi:hypothetical protein